MGRSRKVTRRTNRIKPAPRGRRIARARREPRITKLGRIIRPGMAF